MKARKSNMKITKVDYIKAVKIAEREANLGNGWVAVNKFHKNKKSYNRKRDKKVVF